MAEGERVAECVPIEMRKHARYRPAKEKDQSSSRGCLAHLATDSPMVGSRKPRGKQSHAIDHEDDCPDAQSRNHYSLSRVTVHIARVRTHQYLFVVALVPAHRTFRRRRLARRDAAAGFQTGDVSLLGIRVGSRGFVLGVRLGLRVLFLVFLFESWSFFIADLLPCFRVP